MKSVYMKIFLISLAFLIDNIQTNFINSLFSSRKETYVTTQLEGIATMIRSSMLSTLYQHLVASKKCKKIVNTSVSLSKC